MIQRLKHLTHEMARQARLFSLNKRKLRRILAMYINTQWEGMSKRGADSPQ